VTVTEPESAVSRALQLIAEDLAAKVSVAAVHQNNFIPINVIG
jgi:hypothetical protein